MLKTVGRKESDKARATNSLLALLTKGVVANRVDTDQTASAGAISQRISGHRKRSEQSTNADQNR